MGDGGRERKREREGEEDREGQRGRENQIGMYSVSKRRRKNEPNEEEVGSSACLGSIPDHRRWFINSEELKRP